MKKNTKSRVRTYFSWEIVVVKWTNSFQCCRCRLQKLSMPATWAHYQFLTHNELMLERKCLGTVYISSLVLNVRVLDKSQPTQTICSSWMLMLNSDVWLVRSILWTSRRHRVQTSHGVDADNVSPPLQTFAKLNRQQDQCYRLHNKVWWISFQFSFVAFAISFVYDFGENAWATECHQTETGECTECSSHKHLLAVQWMMDGKTMEVSRSLELCFVGEKLKWHSVVVARDWDKGRVDRQSFFRLRETCDW